MKIGMFGHRCLFSRKGGIDVVVTELSRCMAARGHQVVCYDRDESPVQKETVPGIEIRKMPTVRGKGLAAVSSSFFASVCSSFSHAEVVHIHGEGPAFFSFLPRWLGKHVVVTVHGLDWQREKWRGSFGRFFIRWGEWMAVHYAHEIIVLSRAMQQYFQDIYGRKTVYIPNGTQKAEIAAAEQIKTHYGLSKDSYLLFLGRLVPEKGIHHLIKAYREVRGNKKLVIAGTGSDTDTYVNQLQKLAEMDTRVLFVGFVQGQMLQELYSSAYLYVLPSSVEGMPLSLLEAMRYGCCCLVSDIPECTEVLGENGIVFPSGNEAELTKQLRILCETPEMVQSHRVKEETLPSWEEIAEKTLELYR